MVAHTLQTLRGQRKPTRMLKLPALKHRFRTAPQPRWSVRQGIYYGWWTEEDRKHIVIREGNNVISVPVTEALKHAVNGD
jgi:hypothetical protein